jgi:hypothetical protein
MLVKKISGNRKLSVGKIIFFTLITTIIISIITLSKYKSEVKGSDSATVATPCIYLDSSKVLEISLNPTAEAKEYVFSVSNSKDNSSSEVSMAYKIQIETMNNLPLDFELYTYDNGVVGTDNLFENNGSITKDAVKFEVSDNQTVTNTYKLIIKWRENNTSYKFNQVEDYIKIVVNSTQID